MLSKHVCSNGLNGKEQRGGVVWSPDGHRLHRAIVEEGTVDSQRRTLVRDGSAVMALERPSKAHDWAGRLTTGRWWSLRTVLARRPSPASARFRIVPLHGDCI